MPIVTADKASRKRVDHLTRWSVRTGADWQHVLILLRQRTAAAAADRPAYPRPKCLHSLRIHKHRWKPSHTTDTVFKKVPTTNGHNHEKEELCTCLCGVTRVGGVHCRVHPAGLMASGRPSAGGAEVAGASWSRLDFRRPRVEVQGGSGVCCSGILRRQAEGDCQPTGEGLGGQGVLIPAVDWSSRKRSRAVWRWNPCGRGPAGSESPAPTSSWDALLARSETPELRWRGEWRGRCWGRRGRRTAAGSLRWRWRGERCRSSGWWPPEWRARTLWPPPWSCLLAWKHTGEIPSLIEYSALGFEADSNSHLLLSEQIMCNM